MGLVPVVVTMGMVVGVIMVVRVVVFLLHALCSITDLLESEQVPARGHHTKRTKPPFVVRRRLSCLLCLSDLL